MSERIIRCSCVGYMGRFGNALIQYAFAKAYAEQQNAVLEIPLEWVGRKLFKHVAKERPLSSARLQNTNLEDGCEWGSVNIDLNGYFQGDKFYKLLSISKLQKWFEFSEPVNCYLPKKEKYYVCAHLRRGDLAKHLSWYPAINTKSYLDAFAKFGFDEKKIVWVSEENPHNHPYFDKINAPWMPDFMMLVNSDVLFRSNSSFSFLAGILRPKRVFSPVDCEFPAFSGKRGWVDVDFVESISPEISKVIGE